MAYLGVTEPTGIIRVNSGPVGGPFDWEIAFYADSGGMIKYWYQDGVSGAGESYASEAFGLWHVIHRHGSTFWYLNDSINAVMVLKENTPNRVKIEVRGNLGEDANQPYILIYTIYPSGYITIDWEWNNTSGSTRTFDTFNYLSRLRIEPSKFTNGAGIVDNNNLSPVYNADFWKAIYSTDPIDTVASYVININNSKAHQIFASVTNEVALYSHETSETYNIDEGYKTAEMLYIGGQETTEPAIEADGIFLLDWALE